MENCNEFCREIDVSTRKSMFRSLFRVWAAALVMYLAIPYVDIWAFLWK